jgi:hypothetical protein
MWQPQSASMFYTNLIHICSFISWMSTYLDIQIISDFSVPVQQTKQVAPPIDCNPPDPPTGQYAIHLWLIIRLYAVWCTDGQQFYHILFAVGRPLLHAVVSWSVFH